MQRFGSASAAKLFAEKIISIGPALVFCLVGNCVPTSQLSKQNPPVFDFINKKEKEKYMGDGGVGWNPSTSGAGRYVI